MTPTQLKILQAIARNQPVMISDLHSDSELAYGTFANIITEMRDSGLVHKHRYKGPVWLTVKGREAIDEI